VASGVRSVSKTEGTLTLKHWKTIHYFFPIGKSSCHHQKNVDQETCFIAVIKEAVVAGAKTFRMILEFKLVMKTTDIRPNQSVLQNLFSSSFLT